MGRSPDMSAVALPLLKVMNLSDNEGWSMFDPDIRTTQRNDTLEAFERWRKFIAG